MLEPDKTYVDNLGKRVTIGGRVRNYSDNMPFVWSLSGDWYDEQSGRMVRMFKLGFGYCLPIQFTGQCIEKHDPLPSAG